MNKKELNVREAVHEIIGQIGPRVGLAGGKTPADVYRGLSQALNLSQIDFYVVDERQVPRNDEASNFRMISETLAPPKLHDFDTSLPTKEALDAYSAELEAAGPLSLCILGIGPDGHFGSFFPGCVDTGEKVMAAETEAFDVKKRLTMTPTYILQSEKIVVLLKNKPEVLAKMADDSLTESDFPAKILLRHPDLTIIELVY